MSSSDERRPSTFLRLTPEDPVVSERRPSTFLPLAPENSASYPQKPTNRGSIAGNTTEGTQTEIPRRRSSAGSEGSEAGASTGARVLKLGPVHWGEHLDDHKEDFHEI